MTSLKVLTTLAILVGLNLARAQNKELSEANKKFVTSCLKDYVALTDQEVKTKAKDRAGINKSLKDLKTRCLSKDFQKNWQKIANETDADPLLNAQDWYDSWKTEARVQEFDPKSSRVNVILGTKDEEFCLSLGLKNDKIASSKVCKKD